MPPKSGELEAALQRPANYGSLSPRAQWEIDARLGILDWDPTEKEAAEYRRRWKEMHRKTRT